MFVYEWIYKTFIIYQNGNLYSCIRLSCIFYLPVMFCKNVLYDLILC